MPQVTHYKTHPPIRGYAEVLGVRKEEEGSKEDDQHLGVSTGCTMAGSSPLWLLVHPLYNPSVSTSSVAGTVHDGLSRATPT